MKRKRIAIGIGGLMLLAAALYAADQDRTRSVTSLQTINGSGVTARITYTDTGHSLVVNGTASGLNPTQAYATLIYDKNSVPTGQSACLPTGLGTPSAQQMLIGFWYVNPDGTARLHEVKNGPSYVPLNAIGTTSVRLINGSFGPQGFILQACGQVVAHPIEDDDGDSN